MNETSIILSSGSLITLLGFYFKLQKQTAEHAAFIALTEKRLEDLEKDMAKSNELISNITNTLHKIDTRTQVILSKLESKV